MLVVVDLNNYVPENLCHITNAGLIRQDNTWGYILVVYLVRDLWGYKHIFSIFVHQDCKDQSVTLTCIFVPALHGNSMVVHGSLKRQLFLYILMIELDLINRSFNMSLVQPWCQPSSVWSSAHGFGTTWLVAKFNVKIHTQGETGFHHELF